jgi:uncharacterized MnhB-related membrane protein
MLYIGCVLVIVICSLLAIRTGLLLLAALWLALASAVVAIFLYAFGAHEIAVIELSVGTGLVPVLFVFAISLIGGASSLPVPIVPRPVAYGLVLVCILLLGLMVIQSSDLNQVVRSDSGSFSHALWDERGLDMLVQSVLIFAGVLTILNLLTAIRSPRETTERPAIQRQEDTAPEEWMREREGV